MAVKSVTEQGYEVLDRVLAEREEIQRERQGRLGRTRRPERMMWVKPTAEYERVINEDESWITGAIEVREDSIWIQRRINDGELERCAAPPPEPEEQPEEPAPGEQPQPADPNAPQEAPTPPPPPPTQPQS